MPPLTLPLRTSYPTWSLVIEPYFCQLSALPTSTSSSVSSSSSAEKALTVLLAHVESAVHEKYALERCKDAHQVWWTLKNAFLKEEEQGRRLESSGGIIDEIVIVSDNDNDSDADNDNDGMQEEGLGVVASGSTGAAEEEAIQVLPSCSEPCSSLTMRQTKRGQRVNFA